MMVLQRAQVARLLHRRVIHQHLDHRRHEQRVRDAVTLERVEHRSGLNAGTIGVRVALDPMQHGQAHVGEVEHRRSVQVDAAGRGQPFGKQRKRRAAQIGVAQHHALRKAGRAAGVEDAGQVLAAAHGVGHRVGVRNQRLVAVHAGRHLAVAAIDHLAQASSSRGGTARPSGGRSRRPAGWSSPSRPANTGFRPPTSGCCTGSARRRPRAPPSGIRGSGRS